MTHEGLINVNNGSINLLYRIREIEVFVMLFLDIPQSLIVNKIQF